MYFVYSKPIDDMKNLSASINILIVFSFLISNFNSSTTSAQSTISTDGAWVKGPCGDSLILRGINYAPYNWGYGPDESNISEIAKSGANCVRLVWYNDTFDETANAVYQDYNKLESVLEECIEHDLIPILELHDLTCDPDTAFLLQYTDWYLQDEILDLIVEFEHSLILNLFNEALHVQWTYDAVLAEQQFFNTYRDAILKLRMADIRVPIMIDGADCGINLWSLANVASALINEDPLSNLIFSSHAYWAEYANEPQEMDAIIQNAVDHNFPLVIGELPNFQDDFATGVPNPCFYDINYEYLADLCKAQNIGWMVWSWDRDICADRQMSVDGSFDNLTAFGDDMIYNTSYGLLVDTPKKSEYLINDLNCISVTVEEAHMEDPILIYPNPSNGKIKVESKKRIKFARLFSVDGVLLECEFSNNILHLNTNSQGVYQVVFQFEDGYSEWQMIVKY